MNKFVKQERHDKFPDESEGVKKRNPDLLEEFRKMIAEREDVLFHAMRRSRTYKSLSNLITDDD